MERRRVVTLTHCPNCGTRIVPTPKELKQWRLAAKLSQREIASRLKISGTYVAYLESGKRTPSATVIARYRKLIPKKKGTRWLHHGGV
jgi:predicted transcriptional regulator